MQPIQTESAGSPLSDENLSDVTGGADLAIQKMSQMQQALSNVLNVMSELAMSAIRHIKAG